MPCYRDGRGGFICTGHRGIAPQDYHFGWDDNNYPAITDDPDNVIQCLDCGEPAIVCSYWAYELDMAYCENCAWVHRDIFPVARRVRKYPETLEDDDEIKLPF